MRPREHWLLTSQHCDALSAKDTWVIAWMQKYLNYCTSNTTTFGISCTKKTYLQCTMFPLSSNSFFKLNKLRSILKCQICNAISKNICHNKLLWLSNSKFTILSIVCSCSSYRRIICSCSYCWKIFTTGASYRHSWKKWFCVRDPDF